MLTSTSQVKSHTVHVDVIMDVMSILFNNEIPFTVEGINENEKTFSLRTTTNTKVTKHKKALDNIKRLVSDYSFYRYGSDTQSDGTDINIGDN